MPAKKAKVKTQQRRGPQQRGLDRQEGANMAKNENTSPATPATMDDQQFLTWIAAVIYAKPGSAGLAESLALAKNLIAMVAADAEPETGE